MKRRLQLFLLVVGVTAIAAATGALVASASDTPGTVSTSRSLSTNDIVCDGTIDVTVTLDGTPGTAGAKSDVLLVLDQSGSVSSTLLASAKTIANSIVAGIDLTRNKVGTIAFSGKAFPATPVPPTPFTFDGGALISTLPRTPPGTSGTNHADAFLTAQAAFSIGDGRNHVIVMITDGKTTKGNVSGTNDVTEANNAATAAKGTGTKIFTVRLGSSSTTIDNRLKGWASSPDTPYFQAASSSPAAAIVDRDQPGEADSRRDGREGRRHAHRGLRLRRSRLRLAHRGRGRREDAHLERRHGRWRRPGSESDLQGEAQQDGGGSRHEEDLGLRELHVRSGRPDRTLQP